ncbi:hypothetical protein TNCT_258531 [Trichonephila clavata]|uniref:Uncharacterized protein n=1 Tax=Trichonephila clavata TaxID=2740835 RepID=A0A8X6KT62_TRICU|nr:hypothetical protein TNCT_258531 [Trichonephila clavata]
MKLVVVYVRTNNFGVIGLCLTNQMRCIDGNLCTHLKNVCNGKKDCPDGLDEIYCSKLFPYPRCDTPKQKYLTLEMLLNLDAESAVLKVCGASSHSK